MCFHDPESRPTKPRGRQGTDDTTEASDSFPPLVEPRSWPTWRKWMYIVLVGYCECLTFLVSMMLAPSVPQVLSEFRPDGGSKSLGSFSVTVYILGFCVAPLLLGPLTDLHGRIVIYRVSSVCFLLLTVGCALSPSLEALIAFRFFAGCFGGAPMAIGGAVIADMYEPGKRDGPMAMYSVGTMMGPTIGPVLGGVITGLHGWRWVFWVASILAGVAALGLFFILPETHLPTLERIQESRTMFTPRRRLNLDMRSMARTITRAVSLPTRIAGHQPVFWDLVLIAVFNGLVNMILSSLGSIYQSEYHFRPTTAGLSYLGIGLGGLVALSVTKLLKRKLVRAATNRGIARGPEGALLFMTVITPVTSIGLLWYGWAVQDGAPWIVPILGLFFFGFGYMSTRLSAQLFLVEVVQTYTASALAAFTVASSIGGALIPLSTFPLYDSIGHGWGNTIIALVNLLLILIPLTMYTVSRRLGDDQTLAVYLDSSGHSHGSVIGTIPTLSGQ